MTISFSAIILAAGESRRMGQPKMLLRLGSVPVIHRVNSIFRTAGIAQRIIVAGQLESEIRVAVDDPSALIVRNPKPALGMYSSVLCGLAALQESSGGVFIHPGDVPLVSQCLIAGMLDFFIKHKPTILIPRCQLKSGHPVLLDASMVRVLRQHDGADGLRGILGCYEKETAYFDSDESGLLLDMDNLSDYYNILHRV